MANGIEVDLSHIKLGERPLIVCDVDDVVLQFIDPFQLFLKSLGHEFLPRWMAIGSRSSYSPQKSARQATIDSHRKYQNR